MEKTRDSQGTIDRTVTSTGDGLEPVCDPVPVPALVLAWSPVAAYRTGERLVLRGRNVDLNRVGDAFPGGRIDDLEVSRVHARLTHVSGDDWSICDLGSKNGTFVNGIAVAGAGQVLEPGDIVRLGDTLLVFSHILYPTIPDADIPDYLGVSDAAREVRSAISRYAGSGLPVLITGDSGVGKEIVSRALARLGRPSGPVVEFNAANVSSTLAGTTLFGNVKGAFTDAREARPGLFRAADGGTLFIDEVGELPRDVQAQLLRVLEDGMVLPVGGSTPIRVNVRVIAATNVDLRDAEVFRPDLYMRLAQLTIHVPPVRTRREDVPLFVASFTGDRQFSVRALERMLIHPWPLNVREIRGIVSQSLAEAGPENQPVELPRVAIDRMAALCARYCRDTQEDAPSVVTAAHVESALRSSGGNMSVAARMVGRDRAQFYRLVKKFGLNPEDFR